MPKVNMLSKLSKLNLPTTEDYRSIVLKNRPLIDVRAHVEYEKGAFPNSVNLPLLDDEQRRLVGIKYKQSGNAAAIKLGQELINKDLQAQRVDAWKEFVQKHPDSYIYCFRGGQRSQISQMWLSEAGITLARLKNGYKGFRNFLIDESIRISEKMNMLIIGGRTGSGKTLLINRFENSIDLEGIANHRGSSFGRHVTPQPTQIDFENDLAYELIHKDAAGHHTLVIEDESENIGRIHIPKQVFSNLKNGKLILLEIPLDDRVNITFDEYVTAALDEYKNAFSSKGADRWFEDLKSSLYRIRKRVGSERYLDISKSLNDAYKKQQSTGSREDHKIWITKLLRDYYDPMYDYQLKKSKIPVVFKGNADEIMKFIGQQSKNYIEQS